MNRCWGLTRTLHRCRRTGQWVAFCSEHRRQPIGWATFVIFTLASGAAELWSIWNPESEGEIEIAQEATRQECLENFSVLTVTTRGLRDMPPEPFWDTQRPFESRQDFEQRAREDFRNYLNSVDEVRDSFKIKTHVRDSFLRELAKDPDTGYHFDQTYDYQSEVVDAFARFEKSLHHALDLELDHRERTEKVLDDHQLAIADATIFLSQAAASFCSIATADQRQILASHLQHAELDLRFGSKENCYLSALETAKDFSKEKEQLFEQALARPVPGPAESLDARDPHQLFAAAAIAEMLGETENAILHYRTAMATGQLPEHLLLFAQRSIQCLEESWRFGETPGIILLEVIPGGRFEKAGLQIGDVIRSADGQPLGGVEDLVHHLGSSPTVLQMLRDDAPTVLSVGGSGEVGAVVSELIALESISI